MTELDPSELVISLTYDRDGELIDYEGSLTAWFTLIATHRSVAESEMVKAVEKLSTLLTQDEDASGT